MNSRLTLLHFSKYGHYSLCYCQEAVVFFIKYAWTPQNVFLLSLSVCLSPLSPSHGPLINRLAGVRLWWNSAYIWGWLVYDRAKPSRVYDLDTEQWPHTQALCINQLILRWCAQSNACQGEMGQRKYFGERDNLTSELLAKWVVKNVICSLPN